MCTGMEMAAGMALMGGITQAYGAVEEGKSKKSYYDAMAAQDEANAKRIEQTAEKNVGLVQDQGSKQAKQVKDQGAQVIGSQKAAMAASGIGAGSATAEDITRQSFSNEKLDELAVRYNADLKSYDLRSNAKFQADDLRFQSGQNRQAGDNAKRASYFNAGASLLGGASQFAGKRR